MEEKNPFEREVCTPCIEKLKEAGHVAVLMTRGINQKVTCSVCGKRRYGGVYRVSKKVVRT